jgi:hypothetical protein
LDKIRTINNTLGACIEIAYGFYEPETAYADIVYAKGRSKKEEKYTGRFMIFNSG